MNKVDTFIKALSVFILLIGITATSFGQKASDFIDPLGQLNYSSLDFWYARKVKESSLLSGETKELYGVGKVPANSDLFDTTLKDLKSPWGTTNIYSKMVLDIGNTRVSPEKRGNGNCARLETKIRKDNIAGVKVEVLIAGTLFLGEMIEPVRGVKDPIRNVNQGIPFNKHPKAIKFDYKYHIGSNCVKAITRTDTASGPDKAEFCLILQKRWEDKDGNVFATRIGGAREFFTGTQNDWENDREFPVTYGDITHRSDYDAKTMGLIPQVAEVFVKNSKNKMVPIVETGWGKPDEMPTHMILYFTSSSKGIDYIGSPESVFWVDNVELVYE